MTDELVYRQGADLPDLTITWRDDNGALINFASGFTFTLKIGTPGETAVLTKTDGIAGAATDPNVTVTWSSSGELNTIAEGSYIAQIAATQTVGSKQRIQTFRLRILQAIE